MSRRSSAAHPRRGALVAALALSAAISGCASPEAPVEEPAQVVVPAELPTYAAVAAAHNRRVAMLERVWAAASALVTYQDQDGQVRTEQAEGYLQIIQPGNVALSLGKQITSEVYFYLGCNDEKYWWMDRLDAERKVAYVGTHALATPERAARFGAPVHPLDLLDLLGITRLPDPAPLPTAGTPPAANAPANGADPQPAAAPTADLTLPTDARLARSPDGEHIIIDVRGRFGTRRTWFDPASLLPRRVEILDDRARVAVYSTLASDIVVEVRGDSRQRPLMSQNVDVAIPGTQISIRLLLDRIQNRGTRQSSAPFDLDRLLDAYPVGRVEDLDKIEVEPRPEPDEPPPETGVRTPDRRLRTAPRNP